MIKDGILLDNDFIKPQAFHELPVTRSGGIAAIISLSFFFEYTGICFILKFLYDYLLISYTMFLSVFDDIRIYFSLSKRLIMMIMDNLLSSIIQIKTC